MEIHRQGARTAVFIGGKELGEMGLNFETLRERGLAAALLIGSVKAQLHELYGGEVRGDIHISRRGTGVVLAMNVYRPPLFCPDITALCKAVTDGAAALWRTDDSYALTYDDTDPVDTAKLSEHGRLICSDPAEKLRQICTDLCENVKVCD
ncbi:hypothetical protein [Ruminococcus sp.]|uniref:hypothetical protein n=1 Tax=Ruminococcus sp. TaxID=41978 RepID=UPI0025E4B9F5|nr:hypothetical protein [Ruminococcus sp.]MBQ8966099.1 hypothetical protein [Ruminococcus sp.]